MNFAIMLGLANLINLTFNYLQAYSLPDCICEERTSVAAFFATCEVMVSESIT